MGPPQSSRALILRTRAYGESDRIVCFLSEDFGKLSGIAKGARNSRRRFANCLNPTTLVRVHFRSRQSAGLVFMDSCDLLVLPGALVEPLKLAYAGYLIELVDLLTEEGLAVPELFHLLEEGLEGLRSGPATSSFLRCFELGVLRGAGFEPRLDRCAGCDRELDGAESFLDPRHGTLTCEACVGDRVMLVTVPLAVLERLRHLNLQRPTEVQSLRWAGADAAIGAHVLGELLRQHLPRPLKSVTMIAALS